jgi:hypothetical protein
MNLPAVDRLRALSRCVFVENVQQLRLCANSFQNPLIIVASADCRDAAGFAVDKGHHVFLSADAPADSDGVWPHTSVRNVIEQLNNDVVDEHIRNKIFNRRGIVTKAIGEGGKQEQELATKYREMSDALRPKWPRTAKLLKTLGETYQDHAKRSDVDSDLNDLRWG